MPDTMIDRKLIAELTERETREGTSGFDGVALPENVWGKLQAFDDSASLDLHGLTPTMAAEIVAFLRKAAK